MSTCRELTSKFQYVHYQSKVWTHLITFHHLKAMKTQMDAKNVRQMNPPLHLSSVHARHLSKNIMRCILGCFWNCIENAWRTHGGHMMDMHFRIAYFPSVIRKSETDIQTHTSKLLTGTEHQKAEKITLSRKWGLKIY